MNKTLEKAIYWIPRVFSIIIAIFLSLFSLDVFDMGLGFWGTVGALLMHNIPVFILIAAIIIAWKREIVGGVIFILAGLLYIVFAIKAAFSDLAWYLALSWSMIIALPTITVGFLWLVNWFVLKKNPLPGKAKAHKKIKRK